MKTTRRSPMLTFHKLSLISVSFSNVITRDRVIRKIMLVEDARGMDVDRNQDL